MKRVMIAAPASGSGKTLITCALLRLLARRGLDPASFKCGPDYIDPMFHRRVLGIPGGNLDSFFSDEDEIRSIISRSAHEYAVIEGVMGIYDGVTGGGAQAAGSSPDMRGSCYDIARITDTPVVLVMDVKGMGQTMISLIKGILSDDTYGLIRGIILNRISPHYYRQISPLIEGSLPESVKLLGGIPSSKDIHLESRHLGLVMPHEISDMLSQIDAASDLLEEHIDIDALLSIMGECSTCEPAVSGNITDHSSHIADSASQETGPVIAVARDEAFCFYYEENLHSLEKAGIRIREFSPLHDIAVPSEADGILLGGGYPELYADRLSANTSMKESVRKAIESGMPSLAECGGFMYLLDTLTDQEGRSWPMCGALRGGSRYTGRLGRFGYIDITFPDGRKVKGHEFHYFDSDNNGTDAHAVKPGGHAEWDCIHADKGHIWGYPHLWYDSCPEIILQLKEEMIRYGQFKQVF